MTDEYAVLRSVSDKTVHLIIPSDQMNSLPDPHRTRGPWQVVHRGSVTKLLAAYRLPLSRDGSVLIETHMSAFRPEG